MIPFSLIVAVDQKFGIGKDGLLPWSLPGELKHFKNITTTTKDPQKKNVVIMGRRTWESLPEKFRPLPQRINIVLSRQEKIEFPEGVRKFIQLEDALEYCEQNLQGRIENIFIIGGAQVFQQSMAYPACSQIHLTRIHQDFHCDTFFPQDFSHFRKISDSETMVEKGIPYSFEQHLRK
ncbi:MAG: dihydrofolate reductase [Candidatus Omnitrophica bacterium]|nr:dihydrofolate reductase [Candidatus Omnitrophota bacterium]